MSARLRRRAPNAGTWGFLLVHLLFVWMLTLTDLQFFLANTISQPLIYLVRLGYPPMLLMMALRGPATLVRAKPWVWHAPLLMLLVISLVAVPFAVNRQLAWWGAQPMLLYWALSVATALYVRTPKHAMPILIMLFGQFAWFGLFARTSALVMWHPTLSNLDGFGSLMVQGVALCFWFAMACASPKLRLFLFALAGYCVLGVVASYARAAFLSLIAIVGWIWLRSPRKAMTGAAIAIGGIVAVAGAVLIFDAGFFINEIASAFHEGTDEGTGAQRWELWQAGFKVWMQRPIIGVGGGNFGAYAAGHFQYGDLKGFPVPSMLYGFNLHNAYMQVLSEFGTLGIIAFFWCIWDFWKKNNELREPETVRRWAEMTGGRWDLRYLSLGLEAANVANMLAALFYATLLAPAFYTIWIASRMLWALTRPRTAPRAMTSSVPAPQGGPPLALLPAGVVSAPPGPTRPQRPHRR